MQRLYSNSFPSVWHSCLSLRVALLSGVLHYTLSLGKRETNLKEFILLMQIGAALHGEPKNKRGKRKIAHCPKLLTIGRSKFGRFSLTNASFLSEAGWALTFLFTFCVKTKSKSGSQGRKPLGQQIHYSWLIINIQFLYNPLLMGYSELAKVQSIIISASSLSKSTDIRYGYLTPPCLSSAHSAPFLYYVHINCWKGADNSIFRCTSKWFLDIHQMVIKTYI